MTWQVTCKIGSCNADSKTRRSKFTLQSCFLLHHKTVYYSRKNTSGIFYFTLGTVPDLWVLAWLSVKFKRRPGRPPRSPSILFFYMYPNAACSLQVSQTHTTYLSDSELHDRGYLPQNVLLIHTGHAHGNWLNLSGICYKLLIQFLYWSSSIKSSVFSRGVEKLTWLNISDWMYLYTHTYMICIWYVCVCVYTFTFQRDCLEISVKKSKFEDS